MPTTERAERERTRAVDVALSQIEKQRRGGSHVSILEVLISHDR